MCIDLSVLFLLVLLVIFGQCWVPKGSPKITIGMILDRFEGTCGNVKIMFSFKWDICFEGWRVSRETSCAASCAQLFSRCFSEQLFRKTFAL